MFKNAIVITFLSLFIVACDGGFQRFVPPSNSISGRGAKVNPTIISTTPTNNASVSPVTGANGTQLVIVFSATMDTTVTPVVNTYFREIDSSNQIAWYPADNSSSTFTWSSTNFANDTLTIQLGWVRWPENNIIGFDFDNTTLVNLDAMPLVNTTRFSFTVGWDPGKYKIVQTGQYACYRYQTGAPIGWLEETACYDSSNGGGGVIGTQDYPAAQNGFVEPRNIAYGSGLIAGRRFDSAIEPHNRGVTNTVLGAQTWPMTAASNGCNQLDVNAPCYPYTPDPTTNLIWKTCSQGQPFEDVGNKCFTSGLDYTWGQAVNACATLNTTNSGQGYAGRTDWRLPTVQELENLVDYGARISVGTPEPGPGYPEAPAIQGYQETVFPYHWEGPYPRTSTISGYWTATGLTTLYQGNTLYSNAYIVEFKKGSMGAGGSSGSLLQSNRDYTGSNANYKKVRCVAGPVSPAPVQTLTPSTQQSLTQALTTQVATFTGFDNNATFNIVSAQSVYDIASATNSIVVTFNIAPDATPAGNATNYCIGLSTDTSFATCTSQVSFSGSATASGTTVTLASAIPTPGIMYRLFVKTPTMTATGGTLIINTDRVLFSANAPMVTSFSTSSFNVLRASAPTATTVQVAFDRPPDVGPALTPGNYCVGLPAQANFAACTGGGGQTPSAVTLSKSSVLLTVGTPLTAGTTYKVFAKLLTTNSGGTALVASSAVIPLGFNILNATSPSLTSVQLTFDNLPDATAGAVAANYCITTAAATSCLGPSNPAITSATVTGYTVTLATATPLVAGTPYSVFVSGIKFTGAQVVTDAVNNLLWQRCRKGLFDIPTCTDDGVATNDVAYWNDALNYCNNLNATNYAGYTYGWRAATINELKSISNRSLFGTVGVAMDTTIFPTPNLMAEDHASSTNYSMNGTTTPGASPNYNLAWGFNYYTGFSSIVQKDYSTLLPVGLKPPKKSIRCVRSLP